MSIVDERGRIGGRINLIDALAAFGVLVLIPVAFGAYLLFRTPSPMLTSINPARVYQGPNLRIEISGKNLRPFMRVSFNTAQGRTFLIGSTSYALVDLPDLDAGTYDVVLYDYMQEVSRLRVAFTLDAPPPPPTIPVEVSGVLTSITPEQVKGLQVGYHFPEGVPVYSELLSIGRAEPETLHIKTGDRSTMTIPAPGRMQLPVRIRMRCVIEKAADGALRCAVNGVPLVSDANVAIPAFGKLLNLRVDEVAAASR
jgi:hypothetical protein